jgi:N4-gp56 family major capsid protein
MPNIHNVRTLGSSTNNAAGYGVGMANVGAYDATSPLTPRLQAVYDKTLLKHALLDTFWDKYGMVRSVPARSNTKKAFAYRYRGMLPATTPLAEYNGENIKSPNKVKREEVEYSVAHYGDYLKLTDELKLYDLRDVQSDYLELLGEQAKDTMEAVRRNAVRGTTNIIYGNHTSNTTRANVISNNADITAADIDLAVLKLKHQKAKRINSVIEGMEKVGTRPVRGGYVGVCSHFTTPTLRGLDGWINVEEYADYSKRLDETEIGSYGDVRFCERVEEEGIVCLADGTEDDSGSHIVEQTMIFGKDAYATTTLRGKKGIETIVKPLGSAGAADPLNQYGTIGWKAIGGAAVINDNWIIKIEHKAANAMSVAGMNAKHYLDV